MFNWCSEPIKDKDAINNQIDEITNSIYECQTAWGEYAKAIRETDWKVFDIMQDRISDIADESQFLIDLMSNEKLYDDRGQLTDKGMATMGLHGVNYNTYMGQADMYAEEIKKIQEEIEKDPLNQDVIDRYYELVDAQREAILAAEDEKNFYFRLCVRIVFRFDKAHRLAQPVVHIRYIRVRNYYMQ